MLKCVYNLILLLFCSFICFSRRNKYDPYDQYLFFHSFYLLYSLLWYCANCYFLGYVYLFTTQSSRHVMFSVLE